MACLGHFDPRAREGRVPRCCSPSACETLHRGKNGLVGRAISANPVVAHVETAARPRRRNHRFDVRGQLQVVLAVSPVCGRALIPRFQHQLFVVIRGKAALKRRPPAFDSCVDRLRSPHRVSAKERYDFCGREPELLPEELLRVFPRESGARKLVGVVARRNVGAAGPKLKAQRRSSVAFRGTDAAVEVASSAVVSIR